MGLSDPDAQQFKRMGKGRVGTYRTNFAWSFVQPEEFEPYVWGYYDALVERAARNSIRVLPTIYSTPKWAAAKWQYPPSASDRDEFERFVKALVGRYGPGGSFWSAHPTLPRLAIRDWQLWNEQNTPTFWTAQPSPQQYMQLLIPAERAIHSVDPSARLVLGGMFPKPYIENAISLKEFLTGLYQAGGKDLFDAVAVHPYALNPKRAMGTVDQTRKVMRSFGDGKKPLWITEVGWASSGESSGVTVSPKVQARYLTNIFKLAARSRKRLHIAGVIWFSLRDQQSSYWVFRTGMFTAAGKAKPSWKAFVRLTRGRR